MENAPEGLPFSIKGGSFAETKKNNEKKEYYEYQLR